MQEILVRGGRPIRGDVKVSGAKNAALPIMAASVMVRGAVLLDRVPRLSDVETMARILRLLGVTVEWVGPDRLLLVRGDTDKAIAPPELVRQMRGSICVLGPLLATRGRAVVPLPGGCVLGPRPIDLHLRALEALGANIQVTESCVEATATRLRGARLRLAGPFGSTVLGTANAMMAAALAEGRTVIEYAAREPEVQDLANFLNACGARIQGAGSRTVTIDGVDTLRGGEHRLIPDRIEAGTLLAAGAITGGEVHVEGARIDHMQAVINIMRTMGCEFDIGDESITLRRPGLLRATRFATGTYPGIPTDMQPQLGALLCCAPGTSVVGEGVYPDRFTHVEELRSMGARISVDHASATIEGGASLQGARVHAADLRAGAALVIAGLAAEGQTTITGVNQIDRGYESLEEKLQGLGADIRRQSAKAAAQTKRKSA